MDRRLVRRIVFVAGLLALTLLIGTVGFQLIEGYSLFDAYYMTLTTIITLGNEQSRPLSHAGKIFNSFLVLFGVIAMFISVGAITQTIIDMELRDPLNTRRTKRMIDKMQDHFIVCGFGRVGCNASFELQRAGVSFLIIDRSGDRVERAIRSGMVAVLADSTRDESLREAGVGRARGLIAALATDADNLFVILSAKNINPNLTVVTRAAEEDAEEKLRRAGADTVFAPYTIAGLRLAQALLRPHVSRSLDLTIKNMGLDVAIEQVQVGPGAEFPARRFANCRSAARWEVIVLAIRNADGQMVFNPPAEMEIHAGDFLIVLGEHPHLRDLEDRLTADSHTT